MGISEEEWQERVARAGAALAAAHERIEAERAARERWDVTDSNRPRIYPADSPDSGYTPRYRESSAE